MTNNRQMTTAKVVDAGGNSIVFDIGDMQAREAIDNNIVVQNTQPTSQYNKLWILDTTQSSVEVPTMDEFNNLNRSVTSMITEDVSGLVITK